MAAAGFNHGADDAYGYDEHSFLQAVSNTATGWSVPLRGQSLVPASRKVACSAAASPFCKRSLGTPWELDTTGAILVLEDRGMKPYQVDRALLHLMQAGKFSGVKAIVLGEFPDGDAAFTGQSHDSRRLRTHTFAIGVAGDLRRSRGPQQAAHADVAARRSGSLGCAGRRYARISRTGGCPLN